MKREKTMNVELSLNNENITNTREIAHKAVLAYAGLWGMAYDSVKYGIENSQELLEKAEKRGEELEQGITKWYDVTFENAGASISKLRESYGENLEGVKESVVNVKDSVSGMKESVVGVKESVVNVKDVVAENTKGIQEKVLSTVATVRPSSNGKDVQETVIEVTEEAKEEAKEEVSETLSAPFEGYDGLTAKDLIAKLDGMDDKALELVKSYEEATKNRVTILRDIDERLEKAVA